MKRKTKPIQYLIAILISILLFASVMLLMQHVQKLLLSDVRLSLSEIVNQNKDVISSKLTVELNNLNLIAQQVSDKIDQTGNTDGENIKKMFLEYVKKNSDESLCYSDLEGNAVFGGGQEVNIAGRKYFQLAVKGGSNVSEQIVSRLNGEDVFVIAAPLYYNGEIIGTLQKQYPPKEMHELCSISLFSQQGSMYIINSDGYIFVSSDDNYKESSNYYRTLHLTDADAATSLAENVRAGKTGFMEIKGDGKSTFSAYTPLKEIHDWYLITNIDTSVIIPNVNTVIRLFYVILILVVFAFAIILFYNLQLKRRQQLNLETLAFVDNVTGGDTYTKFEATLTELLEQADSDTYYILAFDIDGFHYINRFYGFEIGDKILKQVYALCAEQLQQGELLSRTSADCFVAALKNPAASWLDDILCKSVTIEDIIIYFSAGLYPVKDKMEGLSLMIDKATLASTEAKGKRFKKVGIFSREFDETLAKNEHLKQEIDRALEESEFTPYFQPKVDIYDNRLVGAEALARWIKKDGTVRPPSEFIPISEQTGVIRLIDWAIFEKTLQFLRRNLDRGVHCVPISVNFSRSHLFDKEFADKLKEQLDHYHVPGHLIEVELTETTIFDNAESINTFIKHLHNLDLIVSMDDFGSGYSSLNMLKDVDIDVIKIDQAFLNSATDNTKQQIIFETIIQMSKKLQLETVVEGVETAENVAAMRKTECTVAQGYFFARPMSSDNFEAFHMVKGETASAFFVP